MPMHRVPYLAHSDCMSIITVSFQRKDRINADPLNTLMNNGARYIYFIGNNNNIRDCVAQYDSETKLIRTVSGV